MSSRISTRVRAENAPAPSFTRAPNRMLQRKCACGGTPGPTGECNQCKGKRLARQRKLAINEPGDRYEQEADRVAETIMTTPDGTEVKYLRRRFVPPPENFALLQEHTVTEGERLDHIAAKYLGDPEQFWRLCDANGAIRPNELIESVGRRIRITLPENIPGPQNE